MYREKNCEDCSKRPDFETRYDHCIVQEGECINMKRKILHYPAIGLYTGYGQAITHCPCWIDKNKEVEVNGRS